MFRVLVGSMRIDDDIMLWFFFFKQKTAYEMRISDWSSDVCSSDLGQLGVVPPSWSVTYRFAVAAIAMFLFAAMRRERMGIAPRAMVFAAVLGIAQFALNFNFVYRAEQHITSGRSEEHTSELQSLMRISYAVFCLKKKTNKLCTHKDTSIYIKK